jgi:hypothetical protein
MELIRFVWVFLSNNWDSQFGSMDENGTRKQKGYN